MSDEFTVPVCRVHHRELNRSGDEAARWQKLNIDADSSRPPGNRGLQHSIVARYDLAQRYIACQINAD